MTTERIDADEIVEPHVSLADFAALTGLASKTILNRLATRDPEIRAYRPTKILGHWRFPVSAIREQFTKGRQAVTGKAIELPPLRSMKASDQGPRPRQQRPRGDQP